MNQTHQKATVICLFLAVFVGSAVVNHQLQSASLTSVSVTSSNPRLSFRGGLAAGNTEGSSVVTINTTTGSYPSTSSAQLVEGDVLRIGSGGGMGSYTVASTSSLSTFTITSGLGAGNADADDDVISSSSATLTVRFTTANAIADGRFRILVPALPDVGAASDGIPDGGFFDFGTSTVTCPNDTTGYDFVAGTASPSAITINGNSYHSYECAYSGAGGVGTQFDAAGSYVQINNIINPAPKGNHTTGIADTYNVVVQQLNSGFTVQDFTTVSIGVIEAVKVTASVAPQITFQIIGLSTGTSACGVSTTVGTTPASVPFGEVSISAFTNAAQALTASTNAAGGFVVTAIENDQLGKDGGACPGGGTGLTDCIPDAEVVGMTPTVEQEWTTTVDKGFAYSLDDVNGSTTPAFQYNDGGGTYLARHFADAEDSEAPVPIFGGATVADNENLYVCYRIVVSNITEAGNYENYLTYNATATF